MLRRIHSSRGREPWADPAVLFAALGDETRLRLVSRLCREGPLSITRLSDGLPMTRQAVTKHLAILEEANLVTTMRRGREKEHYLNPVPINEIAERWIGKFEQGRLRALSALKQALEGSRDDE